jgi:tRNA(Ile)-lysidine synthase
VSAVNAHVAELRRTLLALEDSKRGVVVAVSGGPDSVALLRALLDARETQTPLVIAHLNHQLRGADSDADEAFVAEMHAKLAGHVPNLLLEIARRDVAAEARAQGDNLESHARNERYRWLAEVAGRFGLRWVTTGHTANDQAETVLHRLLRGTGLQGLRGIAARRELEPEVTVVRPLLGWTRADVRTYLDTLGQPFRVDASNEDRSMTRNRIRHELLPLLAERFNPAIVSVLGRLARHAEEAFQEEEAAALELLREVELPRAGEMIVLDRPKLAAAPRHRVRQVFRAIWRRESWPLDDMPFAAWERLAALVVEQAAAADFPGNISVHVTIRVVQLARKTAR